MNAALEFRGASKAFGRFQAVKEVTLAVRAGERVALLGHNGAGKSTLMKMALGLLPPSAGTVSVLGGRPGRREVALGFLPENVSFHPAMSGFETLAFYARLKGRGMAEARALLEKVGLAAAARQRVGTYSKGMRQRLGLAQALLGRPRLMLLDEPTTGLDPASRGQFYDIVRDLAEAGAGILLSSHLLTELEARTDRVAILERGRLLAQGSLADLRAEADLPVVIRVVPAPGRAGELAERLGGTLELQVPAAEKMAALARVLALGKLVRDVEVEAPGLDALYARHAGSDS